MSAMRARTAILLSATMLGLALAASGNASAQAYGAPYGASAPGQAMAAGQAATGDGYYDYARVVRVVPVPFAQDAYAEPGQHCTTRRDAYAGDYYGPDGRYHAPGETVPQNTGSEGGRTAASILGTVIGAVVGSQVGGGSARYATAAVGSAVGGIAGRQVYDNAHRDDGAGLVTVCDPVDAAQAYPAPRQALYDVTYEFAGRNFVTRTNYDPGQRILVRIDLSPQ